MGSPSVTILLVAGMVRALKRARPRLPLSAACGCPPPLHFVGTSCLCMNNAMLLATDSSPTPLIGCPRGEPDRENAKCLIGIHVAFMELSAN